MAIVASKKVPSAMEMNGFTICSTNYFAQAKVLAKSWQKYHPNSGFFVILVDKIHDNVDYYVNDNTTLIPVDTIPIANFDALVQRYSIVELNTAVKADSFLYLFEKTNCDKLIYLDPDIQIYSDLTEVSGLLDIHDIILTPHFTTPIDDGYSTSDFRMLGSGLFNLGFIALARLTAVSAFLNWWRDRLYKYSHFDLSQGMFYDQVWCNYVVVFFSNHYILTNPGYNMANWNLHERTLAFDVKGRPFVNKYFPLRFFHFSGYKFDRPNLIATYHTRYSFETRPDIVQIFKLYQQQIVEAGIYELSKVPCSYALEHDAYVKGQEELVWSKLSIKWKIAKVVKFWLSRMLRR